MKNILKIGTYNIKHGSDNGRYTKEIGRLLFDNGLDIIGIQEIDLFVNRSGNKDILKEIAVAGNYQYYRFYKAIDYQNGDYGLGIISKYPIIDISVTKLNNCQEQRILVHSQIDVNGRKINFLVTHLELGTYEKVRIHQFKQIETIIKDLNNFIITGDFNVQDWTKTGNIFEFEKHFDGYNLLNNPQNTYLTYSGKESIGGGITPIDNIITSNNIKNIYSKMVDTYYSDHDLLMGEFIITD